MSSSSCRRAPRRSRTRAMKMSWMSALEGLQPLDVLRILGPEGVEDRLVRGRRCARGARCRYARSAGRSRSTPRRRRSSRRSRTGRRRSRRRRRRSCSRPRPPTSSTKAMTGIFFSAARARMRLKMRCDWAGEPPGELIDDRDRLRAAGLRRPARASSPTLAMPSPARSGSPPRSRRASRTTGTTGAADRGTAGKRARSGRGSASGEFPCERSMSHATARRKAIIGLSPPYPPADTAKLEKCLNAPACTPEFRRIRLRTVFDLFSIVDGTTLHHPFEKVETPMRKLVLALFGALLGLGALAAAPAPAEAQRNHGPDRRTRLLSSARLSSARLSAALLPAELLPARYVRPVYYARPCSVRVNRYWNGYGWVRERRRRLLLGRNDRRRMRAPSGARFHVGVTSPRCRAAASGVKAPSASCRTSGGRIARGARLPLTARTSTRIADSLGPRLHEPQDDGAEAAFEAGKEGGEARQPDGPAASRPPAAAGRRTVCSQTSCPPARQGMRGGAAPDRATAVPCPLPKRADW